MGASDLERYIQENHIMPDSVEGEGELILLTMADGHPQWFLNGRHLERFLKFVPYTEDPVLPKKSWGRVRLTWTFLGDAPDDAPSD